MVRLGTRLGRRARPTRLLLTPPRLRYYRYLRTAELYAETAGDAAAQQVVEQVRGALLNSADREQCYLIRARAYLQLANFDNAKRDLGAPPLPALCSLRGS